MASPLTAADVLHRTVADLCGQELLGPQGRAAIAPSLRPEGEVTLRPSSGHSEWVLCAEWSGGTRGHDQPHQ